MNEFRQALNSLFDILHLHPDGVDEVIDEALEVLNMMPYASVYPIETLAMIKRRAEAIREAVKNNPLPDRPESCKQQAH